MPCLPGSFSGRDIKASSKQREVCVCVGGSYLSPANLQTNT